MNGTGSDRATASGNAEVRPLQLPPSGVPRGLDPKDRYWLYPIVLLALPIALAVSSPLPAFGIVVLVGILFGVRSRQRRRPVLNYLREQIQSRPACIDRWGNDLHRRELAEVACRVLAKEMKWPNANFLPDDPVDLLTFNLDGVDDQIEIVIVAKALETATNRKLSWDKTKPTSGTAPTTLGNIIDAAI